MKPDSPFPQQTLQLLRRVAAGESEAEDELFTLLQGDLHARALRIAGRASPTGTLQATALVNEAWLRIAGKQSEWNDRAHFLRVAARAMRYALVDHARARQARKRGGSAVPLPETGLGIDPGDSALNLLALHEAMERLEKLDSELHRVAELRIFGGLGSPESAQVLGVSSRTVERAWRSARAWLRAALTE